MNFIYFYKLEIPPPTSEPTKDTAAIRRQSAEGKENEKLLFLIFFLFLFF